MGHHWLVCRLYLTVLNVQCIFTVSLQELSYNYNILITFLFLLHVDLTNAAMAITGHLEDNKASMNTLPWSLANEWKGEVHR